MLEKFIKLDKFLANLMKLKENSSLKVQQIYFFDLFALSEKKGNYMKEVKIFNRFFSDLDKSKEFFINTVKAPIFLSNLVCLMKEIHDKFSNNKHIANENEINDIEKLKSKYIKTTLKQIEEKLINFTQFDQSKDYKRLMRKMEKHFKESIEKNKSKINKVDKVEFVNSILEMSERKISKIIFSRFKKEITQNFYQFTEEIKTMIGEKKTSVIFPRYDLNINKSSWKHSIINNFIYMSFFANIVLLNCRLPTNSSVQIYLKITNNLLGFWNLYDLKNGLFEMTSSYSKEDCLEKLMKSFKRTVKTNSDKIKSVLFEKTEQLFTQCMEQIKKSKEMSEGFLKLRHEIIQEIAILSKENPQNFNNLQDLIHHSEIFPDDKWAQCYLNSQNIKLNP